MRTVLGDASEADDWAWLRLDVAGRRIVAASGEGEGVAELCRALRGLDVLAACALPAPALALDALHAALGPIVSAPQQPGRVLVAMSGGVDSAVALLRAKRAGLSPVGATLQLWADPAREAGARACCAPASVRAARTLCHELGVPHVGLDLRERFRRAVVEPFVRGYAAGLTPNPCVRCNGELRFDVLERLRARLGAERLATGHYARLVERDGTLLVGRARDGQKDQSYMLATVPARALARLWLPLADVLKADVRAEAEEARLAAAGRPESQEACFLAGDDYRAFLGRQGLASRRGALVGVDGAELGEHDGVWRFTPGQRRGHGVAGVEPLYVVETRARRNVVVLGPRTALARTWVRVRPGRLLLDPASLGRPEAKLRYRSPAVPARVEPTSRGFDLALEEPVEGVAPGQVAVLYDADAVVAAGTIASAR